MEIDVNRPARYLTGKVLEGGWTVNENIPKNTDNDYLQFAELYRVTKGNQTALLKALDFSVALIDEDPTSALIQLSKSYDFEKELLDLCQNERLNRVVKILAQGRLPPLAGSIIPVPYFILEYADSNIRSQIDFDSRLNLVWLLRILHNTSVALWQLHGRGIAHTNVGPEVILEFTKKLQKISELGNSEKRGYENPNKEFFLEANPAYMTPEFLYGKNEQEWIYKSQAADIYQLGSLESYRLAFCFLPISLKECRAI